MKSAIRPMVALALVATVEARITRIVIDQRVSPAFSGASYGAAGQYETIAGRAYGVLDPSDSRNAGIQDLDLAPTKDGLVEYMATFQVVKPIDMTKSSGFLWHDVPNRGGRITIGVRERIYGDIGLSSGWQGDNSGATAHSFPNTNDYAMVPVAKNRDGSPITGLVLGRIVNRSGLASQPVNVQANPIPYRPASLSTVQATLFSRVRETTDGEVIGEMAIASTDWAWARCTAANSFPGTPDPSQICLKNGFDANLLYQVVYTAQDPLVLGVGFAAFRDVASFFKNAEADDQGNPNPLAGHVKWAASRGRSQSGNFLRGFLHLGFNQDEDGRQVYEGMWPFIAGRRIGLNFRWAQPDGVLELYQAGSEGPQWWTSYEDQLRDLPESSLLTRCQATKSCPKIFEFFGSAEIYGLKYSPGLTGTRNEADLELPPNVRRYYSAGSTHGNGVGGFDTSLPGEGLPTAGATCSGNNFGIGILPRNPMPQVQTENALLVHFRNWIIEAAEPPSSRYPRLMDGNLVEDTKEAMQFPTLPPLPVDAPTRLMNPLFDYDWGASFHPLDGSGVPALIPPAIKRVVRSLVPKVGVDGNELGGMPVVLNDAPLGTYLGWNIVSSGFHKGKMCGYTGGMIPFARTKADRMKSGDPRLSLEERYGDHAGYVAAVRRAAAKALDEGFLLAEDADALIAAADASRVLR